MVYGTCNELVISWGESKPSYNVGGPTLWCFWGHFGGPDFRFLSENGGGDPEWSNKINWGI
jgi:hypothetical protein